MAIVAVALIASLLAGVAMWSVGLRARRRVERRLAAERAQFEALAHEDAVTGLPNKRAFDTRLDAELRRAAREYYPVSLVALRLPGYRDGALSQVARRLDDELRGYDICARTGDDEFAIALVRVDAHAAERVLGRLRNVLETGGFTAGIAEYPRHSSQREGLARCAQTALTTAKQHGRGGVAIYSASTPRGELSRPRPSANAVEQQDLLSTLHEMARTVDAKSRWTVGHSERVAQYAVALARSLDFPQERLDALRQAALLHDVGKIGVRETILAKEAPYNLEDAEELKRHSELGRAMLSGAGLPELARWVNHVHERFDGEGYPHRLAGHDIPIESRILHVANALDQMTRPNALRRTRPLREALGELSYCSGSRVDPALAVRAIELINSGELKIATFEGKQGAHRALERPRPVA